MKKLILCTLLSGVGLFAQPVSIGVIGGVPITDAFETFQGNSTYYATNTKRWLVGPTFQLNFPARISLEVDALYRRLGYDYTLTAGPGSPVYQSTVANSWQFPVLAKWAIIPGPIRPFVDAGASFRHITGIETIRNAINSVNQSTGTTIDTAPEFNKRNDVGFTVGGGVEFKLGVLRISPEFRYTRWGSESFRDPAALLLRSNRNQGDFLLGITF